MKPLLPEHIVYRGYFRLPDRRGRPTQDRFGGGGQGMVYNLANDSLIVSGHVEHDLVAEVRVPGILFTGGFAEGTPRASLIRDFHDPAPGTYEARAATRLNDLGGIALVGDKLYSTWYDHYAVGDVEKWDVPSLSTGDGKLYRIGPKRPPFTQKATSKYLFRIPPDWAIKNGIGQTLAVGAGDGAGKASAPAGPALFAVDTLNPERATVLLYRDNEHPPPGYSKVDKWSGGAWIRAGEHEAVVFVGEVAVDPGRVWYGAPAMPDNKPEWFRPDLPADTDEWRDAWKAEGIRDTWRPGGGSKGYHVEAREVRLQLYDVREFEDVVSGLLHPDAVLPSHSMALPGFHEACQPRAVAWDERGRRLFVYEKYPPNDTLEPGTRTSEDNRIHVYRVEVPDEVPEPEPPDDEANEHLVRIDVQGVGTFTGSGVWRKA